MINKQYLCPSWVVFFVPWRRNKMFPATQSSRPPVTHDSAKKLWSTVRRVAPPPGALAVRWKVGETCEAPLRPLYLRLLDGHCYNYPGRDHMLSLILILIYSVETRSHEMRSNWLLSMLLTTDVDACVQCVYEIILLLFFHGWLHTIIWCLYTLFY